MTKYEKTKSVQNQSDSLTSIEAASTSAPDGGRVSAPLTHPIATSSHAAVASSLAASALEPSIAVAASVPVSVAATAAASALETSEAVTTTSISPTAASVASSPTSALVVASTTSAVVVEASPTTAVPVSPVARHAEGFFVELLLRLPVVPHHVPLAALQSFTADVVKEALLLVVINLLIFILDFSLLAHLNILHIHSNLLFTILLLLHIRRGVIDFGGLQLVDNVLELVVGLLEVVVIIELERLLLAWLGPAWLEASPAPAPGTLLAGGRALVTPASPHGAAATAAAVES